MNSMMDSKEKPMDAGKPWVDLDKTVKDYVNEFRRLGLIVPIGKRKINVWRVFVPDHTVEEWAKLKVNRPDLFRIGPCTIEFVHVGRNKMMLNNGIVQGYYCDLVFNLVGEPEPVGST